MKLLGLGLLDIGEEAGKFIDWISQYGQDLQCGITRLLYTKEWIDTQKALKSLLEKKGFEAYYDEVGNLFGRLEGSIYIQKIMDMAVEYGDPLAATVGRLEVLPNTVNVVPGKTIFSLDIRHI